MVQGMSRDAWNECFKTMLVRHMVVPGSSPALDTCWICSRLSRVQILGHACKKPTGCLLPVGVLNPVMLYLNYLFSKYLLIVKRFGSLREKCYISVYYYYYYYYILSYLCGTLSLDPSALLKRSLHSL